MLYVFDHNFDSQFLHFYKFFFNFLFRFPFKLSLQCSMWKNNAALCIQRVRQGVLCSIYLLNGSKKGAQRRENRHQSFVHPRKSEQSPKKVIFSNLWLVITHRVRVGEMRWRRKRFPLACMCGKTEKRLKQWREKVSSYNDAI
jgi:hypothetical protein